MRDEASAASLGEHTPSRSLTRRSRTRTRRGTPATSEEQDQSSSHSVLLLSGDQQVQTPQPVSVSPVVDNSMGAVVSTRGPSPVRSASGSAAATGSLKFPRVNQGSQESERPQDYVRKWTHSVGDSSRPTRWDTGSEKEQVPIQGSMEQDESVVSMFARRNNRDSGWTEQSATSSSVYPITLSTISGMESPPSLVADEQHSSESISVPEALNTMEESHLDADDVSFRLRLLMKNSYYLPPAHSKPTAVDLSVSHPPTKKAAAPAFLDLFRVGKSRSKATTPTTPLTPEISPLAGPAAPFGVPVGGRTSSGSTQPRSAPPVDRGRVVVVRETVEDIPAAAKQAEMVMRIRSRGRPRSKSEAAQPGCGRFESLNVDPTDAVDLPPLPSQYQFQLQTSATQGLGVNESLGAAMLADQLPPPPSSAVWSIVESDDSSWRRALLHQAVGHSLNSSPVVTPLPSPAPEFSAPTLQTRLLVIPTPLSHGGTRKPLIGQHIIPPSSISDAGKMLGEKIIVVGEEIKASRTVQGNRRRSLSAPRALHLSSLELSRFPRPASPVVEPAPLTPPPPRTNHVFSSRPGMSRSQNDLSGVDLNAETQQSDGRPHVRKSMSTPYFPRRHQSASDGTSSKPTQSLLPPSPINNGPAIRVSPGAAQLRSAKRRSGDSGSRRSFATAHSDGLHYLSHSLSPPQPSLGLDSTSDLTSHSESPTYSTFRDVHSSGYHTPHSAVPRRSIDSRFSRVSHVSSTFNNLVMQENIPLPSVHLEEEEPRISMSSNTTVGPSHVIAPRHTASMASAPNTPRPSISSSRPSVSSTAPSVYSQPSFLEVDPFDLRPRFPLAERRGHEIPSQLEINTSLPISPAPRSAPQPSSAIEFFDQIQTGPNGMDVLDSSDDEDAGGLDVVEETDKRRPTQAARPSQHQELKQGDENARQCSDSSDDDVDTMVYVNSRTHAISNTANYRSETSLMRLGNHSSPYLTPHSANASQYDFDPMGNLSTVLKNFGKFGMTDASIPASTRDFMRDMQSSALPPKGRSLPSSTSGKKSSKRPSTAGSTGSSVRKSQSIRRLEGRLAEHIEAEKDVIRRIRDGIARS